MFVNEDGDGSNPVEMILLLLIQHSHCSSLFTFITHITHLIFPLKANFRWCETMRTFIPSSHSMLDGAIASRGGVMCDRTSCTSTPPIPNIQSTFATMSPSSQKLDYTGKAVFERPSGSCVSRFVNAAVSQDATNYYISSPS